MTVSNNLKGYEDIWTHTDTTVKYGRPFLSVFFIYVSIILSPGLYPSTAILYLYMLLTINEIFMSIQ